MTLLELQKKVNRVLFENPQAVNSIVLVDTEACKFPAHMIELTDVFYEPELCEQMDENFITLTLDLTGTIV